MQRPDEEGIKPPQVQLNYSLKIINRIQPGGLLEQFEAGVFISKQEMEKKIMLTLEDRKHIKGTDGVQIGYIIPGNGFKESSMQLMVMMI